MRRASVTTTFPCGTPWSRRIVASGTVYRRETPSGASSWVAHATWQEGGKRRQAKRSFRTKKQAQVSLTDLLAAHQAGTTGVRSQ